MCPFFGENLPMLPLYQACTSDRPLPETVLCFAFRTQYMLSIGESSRSLSAQSKIFLAAGKSEQKQPQSCERHQDVGGVGEPLRVA
jgi:hypothetical protein